MTKYIDADALMKEFAEFVRPANMSDFEPIPTWNDAVSLVGSAPTADVVEVIRCVDCKYFREFDDGYKQQWHTEWDGSCRFWNTHSTVYSNFCGQAERRET